MVVFCSFMIHVIVDGITYSFGVLFIALLDDFQSGKGNTAWILSIFVGMTLGSGKYSCTLYLSVLNDNQANWEVSPHTGVSLI